MRRMFGYRPAGILAAFAILFFTANFQGQGRGTTPSKERADPPGFGMVHLRQSHAIRLNVTCFEHEVGRDPAEPCHGVVMFHEASGRMLQQARYDLRPGQSTFVQFSDRMVARFIVPCIIPEAGGRAIPTVEVFDEQFRLRLFENPAAARMSAFNSGFINPGVIAGFNPQPDPPGFGMITLGANQIARMNVVCFAHEINGFPPDPCRGEVMLHNAAAEVLGHVKYDLRPGEATSLRFQLGDRAAAVGIVPCILPARGGRAIPNLEIVDISTGNTLFLIDPAVAAMSELQKQ